MAQSMTVQPDFDDFDALSGALFSWCAERSIRLRSQEGISAAGTAIDLFFAGYRTQDSLLSALTDRTSRETLSA